MNTIEQITERIRQSKPLDFGTIFSDAIELFKKTWIQGFLLQIFSAIIMLPLIIAVYIPFIGVMIAQAESGEINSDAFDAVFAGLSVIFFIFLVVGVLVLGTLTMALQAGFYKIMKKLDYDEEIQTSDFFFFVKGKYLGKLFSLMLVAMLISSAIGLVVALLLIPTFFMSLVIYLYIMVPMSLIILFFAFNPELSVGNIIKGCFILGNKKWLLLFGLMIVSSILSQIVGFLLCGVGLMFTTAFVYHPTYLVYKNVIGFEKEKPDNHIVE